MRPGRKRRMAGILAVVVTAGAATAALADLAPRPAPEPPRGPAVVSSAGAIEIGNSRSGLAVFAARNLVPGQTREGSVRISNPNLQPLEISLTPRLTAGRDLAQALHLGLSRPGLGSLYAGPLAELPSLPLGRLAPGASAEFRFRATLPRGSGDELQGKSGSVDLIWSARAAGPPPKCRLRAMRARFFIFRGRNRIRLVSRYRAAVPGRVRVVFFKRLRGGEVGGRIGVLNARFGRRPHRWGRVRVALRRPPAEMRRFRRSKHGYVAQLQVAGAPGYCRQYLNLDLVQLKRFYGQYVWFQRGSFRTL